jgi:hypothetical protein
MAIRGKRSTPRKKGAFDHIIDDLPRYDGLDLKSRDKVTIVRGTVIALPNGNDPPTDNDSLEALCVALESVFADLLWAVTRACAGRTNAGSLTRGYLWTRRIEDALADMEKRKNLLLQAYKDLVVDYYEIEGSTSVKISEGEGARLSYEPHAVVKDRDAYRKWCLREGFGEQMMLPWQTTNADLKDRLEHGLPEPDGVEAFQDVKIIYVPAR